MSLMFQSAPRDDCGATCTSAFLRNSSASFNPRPAMICGATGRAWWITTMQTCFNPRPAMTAGRQNAAHAMSVSALFQSAPRDDLRGDSAQVASARDRRGFNPRPAMICGATCAQRRHELICAVSIRAPR